MGDDNILASGTIRHSYGLCWWIDKLRANVQAA